MRHNGLLKKSIGVIFIIALDCFLCLFLLEIGLRLRGAIFLSLQEHRNRVSIKQKGECRIMCLGESTTQGQYPYFLEEILNQRNTGISFTVIDKGLGGTTTVAILSQLEANLNKYQPDIVVTMMGISYGPLMYYKDIPEANPVLFRYCRVYKLGRFIRMYILKKLEEKDIQRFGMETLTQKTTVLAPKNNKEAVESERPYYPDPEDSLKKDIELNPHNDNAYVTLGRFYVIHDRLSKAEQVFKKALELDPRNDQAYVGLGEGYINQGRFSEAEGAFKKALELNPRNDWVYVGLGGLYRTRGRPSEAEGAFKKALELNPRNDWAYVGLGWFYRSQMRLSEAEQVFKKVLARNPQNDSASAGLATVDYEMDSQKLSKPDAEKANSLRRQYYGPVTVQNYLRLKRILDERKIKLVAVQYPVRSLASLKQIFQGEEGVIFVNNERIFKEAIEKNGYKEYFVDKCGGDFGHCTEKGNRLLAENIANSILREYFHK